MLLSRRLSANLSPRATELSGAIVQFLTHTLPNGLEIVAECNGGAHSTALGFFVNAGARDEDAATAGVSHFLEHMAFKGTPTRSADDVNRAFDEMGAHYNAFTNEENTVYYASVLPEYQCRAVELLADILRPSLRSEDFDIEKQVILEEIRMYEDQPPFGADDKCRALHFGGHPLGHSVLGTPESIRAMSRDAMHQYLLHRYSPNNVLLAAAGRVDFDALVSSVERCCGAWMPAAVARTVEPAAGCGAFRAYVKETASQQYMIQLSAGPAAEESDRRAAKLLATVLGDDSGSRLFWELLDPGLAEHVSLSHGEHQGAGLMITYLCCEPELAVENRRRILEVFRSAESDGFSAAELDQAKSKVRSRIVLASERPRGRLFALGADWLFRREYRSVEQELDSVSSLTVDDLHSALARFPLTRPTTVTIGPLEESIWAE